MNIDNRYILGVKVNPNISREDFINAVSQYFIENTPNNIICTTNPEFIMRAQHSSSFRNIINSSFLSIPDGVGILMAVDLVQFNEKISNNVIRLFLLPIYALFILLRSIVTNRYSKLRLPGREILYDLCAYAERSNKNIFLLGGSLRDKKGNVLIKGDFSTRLSKKLLKGFPKLNIIGSSSEFSYLPQDDEKTLNFIHRCMNNKKVNKIDLLFVAYNHEKQEHWIMRNKDLIPAKLSIGMGGSYDYALNIVKVPPKIIVRLNLEWFYRLVTQPWRFRRILQAFPLFPIKVFLNCFR